MEESTTYTTGSAPLDQILGGGIPAASTTILAGVPGTGKTILAEQFLFANATEGARALYLTTLSEPLPKVIRYLQRFAFYDPEKLPGVIDYRDLGEAVRERGIEALPAIVEDLLLEGAYTFLVIDSFKALHDLAAGSAHVRAAFFDLARLLAAAGVTALLLGEYTSTDIDTLPEFAIADGVVELVRRSHGVRAERVLRVHKLRGAASLPGDHSFRIDAAGIRAFPRLVGDQLTRVEGPAERGPTGIPGLDPLLGGGLLRGSSTLVMGPSGVGKTRLCLRALLAGSERGEPGVLVSFQETPARVRRMVAGYGLDPAALERDGLLRAVYASPLELDMVELFAEIRAIVERGQARRLVLDALGDLREAAIDHGRFRAMVWSLVQYLALGGITGLVTVETPRVPGLTLGRDDVSYMADNVLDLRYLDPPLDGHDRALRVVKTRDSWHDPYTRPFRIDQQGPEILSETLVP